MRVVFLGTSEFAVPTLRAMVEDDRFEVALVVTQPDSRSGRGRQVSSSPVRKVIEELGLPTMQPRDINTPESVEELNKAKPDILLTAAYGQKLSDEVLAIPRHALNLHGSLLPKYRGASPIQQAICNGDTKTGVTLIGMTSRMDAGPMFGSKETEISKEDTGGTVSERLSLLARDLILELADDMAKDALKGVEQDDSEATTAPALEKDNGKVRWDKTAEQIDCHVRAMTPWPGAYTFCPTDRSPARLIVVNGEVLDLPSPGMPGTVVAFTSGIEVATQQGVYRIVEVKRSGKRALSAVDFLRGFPLPVGTRMM